jgi:hypothetical protein
MNVGIIFMCCAILLWVACSFGSPIGTWPMGVLMVICGLMAILLPMRSIFLLPLVVAGGICVLGGHLILESLGYIPKTIEILSPTEMVVYARQFAFQPGVTILATLAGACLLVAINTTAIFVFRRQSAQAKRQLQMMSWQIRQLVPAVEHETIRPSIRPQGLREGNRFSEP